MASNTPNLGLHKKDPIADGNQTFNIETMLNENWDKIDKRAALLDPVTGKLVADQISINDASTTQKGVVQLNDTKTSTSTTQAATARVAKIIYDELQSAGTSINNQISTLNNNFTTHLADGTKHITSSERAAWNAKLSVSDLKDASTTQKGIVQLANTVTSTSVDQAATANAVKQAYDKAVSVENAGLRLITGTYSGDGTQDRTIFIGATPKLVFVFNVGSSGDESRMFVFNPVRGALLRNSSNDVGGGYLHNMKTVANGFFLSQTNYLNDSGGTYHYFALI